MGEVDRNTVLAADRTVLAAERTYAAWVRTGLSALAAGIGARALLDDVVPIWLATTAGAMLAVFAGLAFVAGVWREVCLDRRLPEHDLRRIPSVLLVVANGFLVLISLAALAGIIFVQA